MDKLVKSAQKILVDAFSTETHWSVRTAWIYPKRASVYKELLGWTRYAASPSGYNCILFLASGLTD